MAGLLNAKEYMKKYKARSIWHKALTCMAAVVVFCTTYALVLPALTLERPADCGYIEHVHNEACYVRLADDTAYEEQTGALAATQEGASAHQHTEECYAIQQGELICTQSTEAAEAHTHTAQCYDETKTLVCSLEESEGHTHGDGCYDEDGELVCGLEESEGHAHDDSCYETNSELVCELSEEAVEPHQHTAECYAQEKVLICEQTDAPAAAEPEITDSTDQSITGSEGLEGSEELTCGKAEGEGAHTHGEGCYNEDGQLICTKAESSGHQHNQFCYGWELICELEEHTHTDACFPVTDEEEEPEVAPGADPTADVEAAADWEATLPSDLPENGAEAVIAVAESQLGYRESADNFIINDENMKKGYTRYGAWYGNPYGDWCAMFVSFCLHYGGVTDFPLDASCPNWVEKLQAEDLYRASGDYTPKAGDLVFYDHDGDGGADHVGLVSELLTEEQLAGENLAGDWEPDDQPADQEPAADAAAEQNTDNTSADSATAPSADENTAAEPSTEPAAEPATDTVMAAAPSVDSAITEELMAEEPLIMGQFANQLMAETAIAEYHATGNVVSGDTEATDRVASQNVTQAQQPAEDEAAESQPADSTPGVEQPADEPQTDEASADQATEANDADQSAAAEEAPVVAIKTIEGNVGNQVQYQVHRIDDERILGYGVLPDTASKTAPNTFQWSNDDITVTVSLPEDAVLPADTCLQVQPITEDTEGGDYAERYQQVVEKAFSNGESKMESLNLYKIDLVSQGKVIEYKCNDEGKKAMVTVKQSDAHWPTTLRPVMAYFSGDSAALMKQNKDDDMQGTFETDLSAEFAVVGAQAALAPNTFQWSDSNVNVTVSLPEDAVLPADAHIEVEKILPEGAAAPTDSNTEEQPEDEPAAPDNSGDAQPLMPMALSLADDTAVAPEDAAAATDSNVAAQPVAPEEETVATDSSAAAQPEAADSEYAQKEQLLQETVFSNGESIMTQLDLYQINLVSDGKVVDYPGTAKVTVKQSDIKWPTYLCPVMIYFPEGSVALMELDEDDYLKGTFETDLSTEFAVAGAELLMQTLEETQNQPVEDDRITVHKTIDAFRGNMETDEAGNKADNPDTNLDNQEIDQTDLYRLYLDVVADPRPVDLLIVVDQSGSMHMDYDDNETEIEKYKDMTKENDVECFRDEALRLVLNGTSKEKEFNETGLVSRFLAMNPENKLAVVEFHGYDHTCNGEEKYLSDPYSDATDAPSNASYTSETSDTSVLLGWTQQQPTSINVKGKSMNATNYCAGLYKADKLLQQVENDGHKKVMLFLSDGVPTQYIEYHKGDYTFEAHTHAGWIFDTPIPEKHDANVWAKGGNGSDKASANLNKTKQKSKDCFDALFKDRTFADKTKLTTYTVGISNDVTGSTGNSEVLQHMATNGGGRYFAANSTKELENMLEGIVGNCTNLVIQDTLSDYVDLYGAQPDFKVTMKKAATATEDAITKVLYKNETITPDGQGKLNANNPVTYDNKKVTATFDPAYKLEPGWTYTLSFNVKTTDTAYKQYQKDEEKYLNEAGGEITGDDGTDYTNDKGVLNGTSSGQPGYHSNTKATATYKRGTTDVEKVYPHPVIQVKEKKLIVQKKWCLPDGTEMETPPANMKIQFKLMQNVYVLEGGTESNPGSGSDTVSTSTISVYTQKVYNRNYGQENWKITKNAVKQGSTVELEFEIASDYHARYLHSIVVNGNTVNTNSPNLVNSGRKYTYTFPVPDNTPEIKIVIRYKDGVFTAPEPDINKIKTTDPVDSVDPVDPVDSPDPTEPPSSDKLKFVESRQYPNTTTVYDLSTTTEWKKEFSSTNGNALPVSETINGKTYYYTYSVKEVSAPGYATTYSDNNKDGITEGTITITNTSGYELPEAGGRGVDAYITAGLLLMTAAAMMLFYIKIWRRRGDSPTS